MKWPKFKLSKSVNLCGAVILGFAWTGCNTSIKTAPDELTTKTSELSSGSTEQPTPKSITNDPLQIAPNADMERGTEVQLVEQMATYRTRYRQHLDLLIQFYDRQGNQLKTGWATEELANIQQGPQRAYLVVAEIAGSDLKSTDLVLEADLLYQEGLDLFKHGRGNLGKMFTDKKKLYQARDKFNQLITDYPTSNKIDDAAFQIGEIHNHYLKDYTTALLYYQRVWQWDPQTTLPVRFWVAKIYDEQLHDRAKAIEFYKKAIKLETSYPNNLTAAKNRIKQLTNPDRQEAGD
jgi:tetratricopeptide (TPR) repeat protein